MSILPPLIAILLALLARQVLVALFVGIWLGATLIFDYNPLLGFLYGLTRYIAIAPADPDKMSIIVFSLTLGGMVGVISRMGGTQGIVDKLAKYASDSRRGQIVTWAMGIFIFFDDYANTLIVGNTMRPFTDKLRISREKLSYLVDSTAAPVANIAIISTWIGFEIGLIGSSFEALGIKDNAYLVFFQTIPYNFYPIFSLILGITIAWFGRDFGPMLKAERRAYKTGQVLAEGATPVSSLDAREMVADENIPKKWYNGFIPISIVIVGTLAGLWFTGLEALKESGTDTASLGLIQYISSVIGGSDSYAVLMWASFLGSLSAILLAVGQKLLSLDESIAAWIGGVKAMVMAALILTMAWSIGNICNDLKTADFIIHITEGFLSPYFIPLLTFLIASIISFATGTSWGVMAILMPIVIPIAFHLPQNDPTISLVQQQGIFLSTIAAVLAGSTFGDHCSPISDTTIMSSMASGADHIDHVRTQLPYAILAGVVSIVVGYLPIGFGISPWIMLPIGILIIVLFIRFYGEVVTQ
ncbi:MAG: Na+/H+ antiporter NhaC family protein [Calditrichales bacterium]|nr:MAG: Na+/H+ antiporter NhaC family protein [Calditrichales bacterium]